MRPTIVTLYDYEVSRDLALFDPPFAALLMAAMQKPDTSNVVRLRAAFPEVWEELRARYNAPGGLLPGEDHV